MSNHADLLAAASSLDAARANVLSLISTIETLERMALAELTRAGQSLAVAGRGSIARSAKSYVTDGAHPVSSLVAAVDAAYGNLA